MGSHRADRRGPVRRPSRSSKSTKYVGRRVAGRDAAPAAVEATIRVAEPLALSAPSVHDLDTTASIPRVATPGKRKAVKHAGPRGPLFKGLPSPPVLLGVALVNVHPTLAIVALEAIRVIFWWICYGSAPMF
jgi:hypothetical protein